jgi:hypothetical protein
MHASAFDRLARTLFHATSRRAALATLFTTAGATLGLAGTQRATAQECLDNGERCHTGDECCSGLCKRRNNGKKVCMRADNQGICTIERNSCAGSSLNCGTGSSGDCFCFVTASGRSFCGDAVIQSEGCGCTSNKQCERLIGKGTKCIQYAGCANCLSATNCMAPCPTLSSPE